MAQVLIIGGTGRIGSSIAEDLLTHTTATVVVTGRNPAAGATVVNQLGSRVTFQPLELNNSQQLGAQISRANLVILTAGPFYNRNVDVLQACIDRRVPYLDVSDERSFTRRALALRQAAQDNGVTAIINTGVFPGISNSMARQGVESLDRAESIQLNYVVAGSGGAGVTVMRTTFIGLQRSFEAWLGGTWQRVQPYTQREEVEFPLPYGKAYVYWYDMPEALTLSETFPVQTVITKFGVVPDFYNHLTWMAAHWFPALLLQQSATIEFLAQVSHRMTQVTDQLSGQGVAVQCAVKGQKAGESVVHRSTFIDSSAAKATGYGTGSLAQLLLADKLQQPGVWAVEQVLSTELFMQVMQQRHLQISNQLLPQPG
jgi:saccharopine dehydrogenase-like NADP-dependent oxidoreductase